MKSFRQLSAAVVLTFTFALPAFAGEIQLPAGTQPPPPTLASAEGEIHTGEVDPMWGIALSLVESVLGLL